MKITIFSISRKQCQGKRMQILSVLMTTMKKLHKNI